MKSYQEKASDFLKIATEFKLGELVTEGYHLSTTNLSTMLKSDLPKAIQSLKDIDLAALKIVQKKSDELKALARDISATLNSGGRVFLCGCGATGRLSLSLETIWRMDHPFSDLSDKVVGFMAGGDVALIHAIERFEDLPEYGERQLLELGFSEKDLLIAITEGGETPFVIGAAQKAAKMCNRKPYFIYCNPDETLKRVALRSKNILENEKVFKINLTVGPMAIAGSTRMQATTVQMMGVGLALLAHDKSESIIDSEIARLISFYEKLETSRLSPFIEAESDHYLNGGYIFYAVRDYVGMTVLTDTTERAPTFSLYPFENSKERDPNYSLCYLILAESYDEKSGWKKLLKRDPRTLEWPELTGVASLERFYGFDISTNGEGRRLENIEAAQGYFVIEGDEQKLELNFNGIEFKIDWKELTTLSSLILLKMILNIHSTLVMGRLGRFEGNLMTYVRPNNNKLIDRTVRYARELLKRVGKEVTYEEVVLECFKLMESTPKNESLVLKIVESLKAN